MKTYPEKQLLEDIYDLIKECALSDRQNDAWAQLSRQHAQEARENLHNFLRNKSIEWDGDNNTIYIGKFVALTIAIH